MKRQFVIFLYMSAKKSYLFILWTGRLWGPAVAGYGLEPQPEPRRPFTSNSRSDEQTHNIYGTAYSITTHFTGAVGELYRWTFGYTRATLRWKFRGPFSCVLARKVRTLRRTLYYRGGSTPIVCAGTTREVQYSALVVGSNPSL